MSISTAPVDDSTDLPEPESPDPFSDWQNQDAPEKESLPEREPTKPVGWQSVYDRRCGNGGSRRSCQQCSPLNEVLNRGKYDTGGDWIRRDEGSLAKGEAGGTGTDHLQDKETYDYRIGEEYQPSTTGPFRTTWDTGDIDCSDAPDELERDRRQQWNAMWVWQRQGQSETAPATNRGPTDDDSQRTAGDKIRVAHRITDQLGCTPGQKRAMTEIMKATNVGLMGHYSDNVSATLAAVHLLTREKREWGTKYDQVRENLETQLDKPKPIHETKPFKRIAIKNERRRKENNDTDDGEYEPVFIKETNTMKTKVKTDNLDKAAETLKRCCVIL